MPRIVIEISELRDKDDKKVTDLADFLEAKVKAKIDIVGSEIAISYEKKVALKAYLRLLIRKFLHRMQLKDQFRVISGKENVLIVKEKKGARVEE